LAKKVLNKINTVFNMAGKLEVEGKEILIKSSNGTMAVIPKDKVSMVKNHIASGNHGMVDKFVGSLKEFKHDNQKAGDGLYANIHAKRQRIAAGSGEHMRKPGEAGAPTTAQFKQAAKTAKAEDGKVIPPPVRKDLIRPDGTMKDVGFYGMLKSPSGMQVSEYSIGVPIMGKEMDIPTLVPGLSKEEIAYVLQKADKRLPIGKDAMGNAIVDKAIQHATQRVKNGASPFYSSVIDKAVPKMPIDNTRVNMQVPIMAKQPMSAMTQKAGDGKMIAPLVKKPAPTPSGPTKKILVAPNPNRATTQDSLDVFNQQNKVDDYFKKKNYELEEEKPYKGDIGKDLDKNYKNFLKEEMVIVRDPTKKYHGRYFPGEDLKDKYRKIKNKNQLYQREEHHRLLDIDSPMPLYDKRIQPQSEKRYKNQTDWHEDVMGQDVVELKSYDPIAVMPKSKMTPEQLKERNEKYPEPNPVEKPEPTPEKKPTPDVEEKPTVETKPPVETTPAGTTPAERPTPKKGPKSIMPRRQGGWSKQPLLMRLFPRLYKK